MAQRLRDFIKWESMTILLRVFITLNIAIRRAKVARNEFADGRAPVNRQNQIEEDDPGRMLLHAIVYLIKHASHYPAEAWIEAENILHRARNQFEDDERIQFVKYLEQEERFSSCVVSKLD